MSTLAQPKRPDTGHGEILVARFTIDLHLSTASRNRMDEIEFGVGEPEVIASMGKAITDALRSNPVVRQAIKDAAALAVQRVVSNRTYTAGLVATVRD